MNETVDEKKRAIVYYRLVVPKNELENLKAKDKYNFDYTYYLSLCNTVKAKAFFKNSRTVRDFEAPCSEDEVEVVHLVVLRNVYNNEVIRKKDANESYVFHLENVWIDDCPFDDYSVLGAKKIVDRVFGSMNARDFTVELAGKTSLKVCGAVYLKGKIYVLTQIIFPDYFPSMPSNLRKEKIYDLDSVQTIGGDDINSFLERRVFQTLAIV